MAPTEPLFFDIAGRRIVYRLREGAGPAIVFLPGYASDMEGTKALALDAFAEDRGLAMLRFDYSGTGSSGGPVEAGNFGPWLPGSASGDYAPDRRPRAQP